MTYQNETRLTHIGQISGSNADVGFDSLRRIVNHRWESFTTQALGNGTLVVGFEHQDGTGSPAPLYDRGNNKRIEYKTHDAGNSEQYKYDSVYRLNSTGSGSQGVDSRGFERGTFSSTARTSMSGGVAFYQDWDLDGLGNWPSFYNNSGTAESRTHSDFNEIVAKGAGTLTHDKNGNTTDDGVNTYEWDALNRLRTATNKGTSNLVGTYTYDCHNRRMRKVVTNSGGLNGTMDFYYEGWRVVEEHDGSDAILRQYTYGNYLDEVWTLDNRAGGVTVAQLNDTTGAQRLFYHNNTLYHVYGITDETGALIEAYQYDAYGKQTVITDGNDGDTIVNFSGNDVRTVGGVSSVGNPFGYTGQREDWESGLLFYKNRYMSAELGRFVSRDPIGYEGGINLYEYAKDNPSNLVDSEGKNPAIAKALAVAAFAYLAKCGVPYFVIAQTVYKSRSDKFRHCWASCAIARDCGPLAAGALGVAKEIRDAIQNDYPKGLNKWDEFTADMDANIDGIKCSGVVGLLAAASGCESTGTIKSIVDWFSESCYDCCNRKYKF